VLDKPDETMKIFKKIVLAVITNLIRARMKLAGASVGTGLWAISAPRIVRARGSCIQIGADCKIHNSSRRNIAGVVQKTIIATIRRGARISIGNGVGMSGVVLVASESSVIGDNVLLGANVKIYDTDFHPIDPLERRADNKENIKSAKIVIRENVWIGAESILLKGVEIGENSIVGAGSVVTGIVPANCIYAGNPAKFIRAI